MIRGLCFGLFVAALSWNPLGAVDFLRGDANSDGHLSLADTYYIFNNLFQYGPSFECESAANTIEDNIVNLADGIYTFNYLFLGGPKPPAPFPTVGPALDGDRLPCESYGSGSAREDPAAEVAVLDSVAPGGANAQATITLAVASSGDLGGYSGLLGARTVVGHIDSRKDLSGTFDQGIFTVNDYSNDDFLRMAYLCTVTGASRIPAGGLRPVLEIAVCLRPGTKAGEYPLTLKDVELIDAYAGMVIRPRLQSGTLRVEQDLAPQVGCGAESCGLPDPPADPAELDATFTLASSSGYRGQEVSMPFIIRTSEPLGGYAFSIDFDEQALRATSVEEMAKVRADGFKSYELNNRNDNPGSGGVDEGFFVGVAVFSWTNPCAALPASVDNEVLRLHIQIRPEAALGATELSFLDGAQGSGTPVRNSVTIGSGHIVLPEAARSFLLVSARLEVLPDLTAFVRGDANGDSVVNISDASATLGFLYLGSQRIACFDAADANDDGAIDIADPIFTLRYLFDGGATLPPPFPEVGEDPTPDGMGCKTRM